MSSILNPTQKWAPRRRGVVALLAMLFMVLFAVLAMGFYAATTISAQLADNDRNASMAQSAAESGMSFMRYQMSILDIPADKAADKILEEIGNQLKSHLVGSGNLGAGTVSYDGTTVAVPADPSGYIRICPSGPGFRALLTDAGAGAIRVKVIGTPASVPSPMARAIQVDYISVNYPSAVFDYGVASIGKVAVKSSPSTKILGSPTSAASILSSSNASPSVTTGKGPIDGNVFVMVNNSQVSLGGGTVGGGTTNADILANHVKIVAKPTFPTVDTTVFKSFATNVHSGASHQKNVRVPAGTNAKFNGGDVVDGILYIESPNNVTFRGNATINGIIVFENKNDSTVNSLDFRGNVSPAGIPNTSEFDALRAKAKGLAIAAPAASLTMSGSVDGDVNGSIVAWSINLAGSADLTLNQGALIAIGPDPLNVQGKTVTFVGNAKDNPPYAGVRLNTWFKPNLATYREVPQ